MDGATYQERLHVPLRWWAQGTMLIASLWLALVIPLHRTPWVAHVAAGAVLVLFAVGMRSYGDARLVVRDGRLHAGRAAIEVHFVGEAEALDKDDTRRVAGRDADVRAFLLLRPYLHRAVKVPIEDPADPAPYWLLSSRHPQALAKALNAARADAAKSAG